MMRDRDSRNESHPRRIRRGPIEGLIDSPPRYAEATVIHGEFAVAPLKGPRPGGAVREDRVVIHGEFAVAPLKVIIVIILCFGVGGRHPRRIRRGPIEGNRGTTPSSPRGQLRSHPRRIRRGPIEGF